MVRRAIQLCRHALPGDERPLSTQAGTAAYPDLGRRYLAEQEPFRRAAKWDGVFPLGKDLTFTQQMTPERIHEVSEYVQAHRPSTSETTPYDLAHWGITTGDDPDADRTLVESYAAVGVTWWMENFNNERGPIEAQRARIRQGPPRLD